jgi:hypothetical protein
MQIDFTTFTETDFEKLASEWLNLSIWHRQWDWRMENPDDLVHLFLVSQGDGPIALTLEFLLRNRDCFVAALLLRLSGDRKRVVKAWLPARDVPIDSECFYKQFFAAAIAYSNQYDRKAGRNLLKTNKDFIVEQWGNFVGLCLAPARGSMGDIENYDV